MADDDSESSSKKMASSKKGSLQSQAPLASDHRLPQQAPTRPSRSKHHSSSRQHISSAQHQHQLSTIVPLPPGSRGPRSLYLHRDGDSFGFTLRHFIVYPPESVTSSDGRHAAVGALQQPMETIFVKHVTENSPAYRAGLHHGDRLVGVNNVRVTGKSYSQVVQLIQHSPPYLHLLVVPKEDDVLQKFFPETAHNPETNQRPTRQIILNTRIPTNPKSNSYSPTHQPHKKPHEPSWRTYEEPLYDTPELYSEIHHPNIRLRSSDQIYSSPSRQSKHRNSYESPNSVNFNIYSEPYDLSECSRAQPQVPVAHKMGRRASEGSNISDNSRDNDYPECSSISSDQLMLSEMVVNSSKMKSASTKFAAYSGHLAGPGDSHATYSSSDSVPCGLQGIGYGNTAGCRLSLDAGRRESTASLTSSAADGSKDSLSSFDSTSTLTGQETDDSIIMTRLRKSFEKKEEFLKRPTQPIGWRTPEERKLIPTAIPREFYSRPQKLHKEWPPNEPVLNNQESPSKNTQKPTHQHFQRVKTDIDSERDMLVHNGKDHKNDMQLARTKFYESGIPQPTQFVIGGTVTNMVPLQRNTGVRQSKDRSLFVTTLSKINESSLFSPENGDDSIVMNGSSSLPVAQAHEMLNDDRRYPIPPNLQIVSRRTRQFESGRPVPEEEEDGSLSDRTNFYRSELSRLSSKRVVPNVAVRKREFESFEMEHSKDYRRDRDVTRKPVQRESRSLEHSDELFDNDISQVQMRARSNSTESWKAALQNENIQNGSILQWRSTIATTDEKQRNKVVRQDSYVSALKSKIPDQDRNKQTTLVDQEDMDISPQNIVPNQSLPAQPNLYNTDNNLLSMQTPLVSVTPVTSRPNKASAVRPTHLTITSPIRPAAGLSPLDKLHMFSDDTTSLSTSPVTEDVQQVVRRTKNNTNSIGDEDRATRRVSYLKATWGDRMHVESDLDLSDTETSPQSPRSSSSRTEETYGPTTLEESDSQNAEPAIIKQGILSCKILEISGKRHSDRSWHKVMATLTGLRLMLYKSPVTTDSEQQLPGGVDMRYSIINIADDYTKRKNVLRISSPYPYGTELFLQAESAKEMAEWISCLQGASTANARLSPQPKTKSTGARNRSPTGQSPKTKTWRGRIGRQLKKLNQGSVSPTQSPTSPEKLTFGVPLESCEMSSKNHHIPKLVELCTEIIEERGLETIGIYRVPGNNAAVSALTEELNKGINIALQDIKSSDTNVVSSLLKSFFRKLPDSLLTSELYNQFIDADKIDDPKMRLVTIKRLLNELPINQYETLKFLIQHLNNVVKHSDTNKMEARNLAIVFGPTLVRNVEDNMLSMVTDMSHQCRIVESLLVHTDWFFNDEEIELSIISVNLTSDGISNIEIDSTCGTVNNSVLIDNITKIENLKADPGKDKKAIVASILQAANKKISKKSRRHESNSPRDEPPSTPTSTTSNTNSPQEKNAPLSTTQAMHNAMGDTTSNESSAEETDSIHPQVACEQKPVKSILRHSEEHNETITDLDLVNTMTSMFDNKIKEIQSPISSIAIMENIPYADESPDPQFSYEIESIPMKKNEVLKESQFFAHKVEQMSPKSYRDPSLHKSYTSNVKHSSKPNLELRPLHKNNVFKDKSEKDDKENEKPERKSENKSVTENQIEPKVSEFDVFNGKELKNSMSDSKIKLIESLNKPDSEIDEGRKLKRSLSLNRAADRLQRSNSLTKYEKTESNINLKKEMTDGSNRVKKYSLKIKRKNGMPERSIKRRHTVGGTKDFDNIHWLDKKVNAETDIKEKKDFFRSSSPDVETNKSLSKDESKEQNNKKQCDKLYESHI